MDEDAARLLASLSSTPEPARHAAMMEWAGRSTAHAIALARADHAWESASRLGAAAHIIDTHGAGDAAPAPAFGSRVRRRTVLTGLVAASAVGGIGTIAALRQRTERFSTDVGHRRSVMLADGTRVDLNTATVLTVSLDTTRRLVRLVSGEAMFDVAHEPRRPFYVEVGASMLRVLGTAFNVRMRDELVELTVARGAVGISDGATVLKTVGAGYGAALRGTVAETGRLDPTIVRQRTAWQEGVIELDGDTLEQAVAEFNRYRSAPIVIGDSRLAAMRIGGRFQTSDSDRFVEAIQQTFPVRAIANADGSVMLLAQA